MLEDVLTAEINAINRQFLEICARHASKPEELCLKLNVTTEYVNTIASMPNAALNHAASLGIFLLQPNIDAPILRDVISLPADQARAHLRSAARRKQISGR